jgi:hypothetical protein
VIRIHGWRAHGAIADLRQGCRNGNQSPLVGVREVTQSHASESPVPGECMDSTNGPARRRILWKYLTQGMINIDGAPFAFTILTNDGQEAIAKAALELIRNASYHSRTTV